MATMEMILLSVIAILGFVGYVLLNFGAKEPCHPHGDLFLGIYSFAIIVTVVVGLINSMADRVPVGRATRILRDIWLRCMRLSYLCSQSVAVLASQRRGLL